MANPENQLTKKDYETLAEFRHTLRQFLSFSELAAGKFGVTPQQYQALLFIQGQPGRDYLTIGELAERLMVRHHSAVGLVNRLENQKLVRRNSIPEDRRKVIVRLTEQGASVLARLVAAHTDELGSLEPRLTGLLQRLTSRKSGESARSGERHRSPECVESALLYGAVTAALQSALFTSLVSNLIPA